KPRQHLAHGRGTELRSGKSHFQIRRFAHLPSRVGFKWKCQRARYPQLPADLYRAIDAQCARSTGVTGEHGKRLGRFSARITNQRDFIGITHNTVPRDAVPAVCSGYLETEAKSDTELRAVVVRGNTSQSARRNSELSAWI